MIIFVWMRQNNGLLKQDVKIYWQPGEEIYLNWFIFSAQFRIKPTAQSLRVTAQFDLNTNNIILTTYSQDTHNCGVEGAYSCSEHNW